LRERERASATLRQAVETERVVRRVVFLEGEREGAAELQGAVAEAGRAALATHSAWVLLQSAPDGRSPYARGDEPESFDKEYVRRWLAAEGFTGEGDIPPLPDAVRLVAARRYISAYERITGEAFVADARDPLPRLRAALQLTA
jgi:hypothetical protein